MAQSITLKMAGKEYPLMAQSPEMEEIMRTAAEEINAMLAKYEAKYPDKSAIDKLVFVTLNEAVSKISSQRRLKMAADEIGRFQTELDSYLSDKA